MLLKLSVPQSLLFLVAVSTLWFIIISFFFMFCWATLPTPSVSATLLEVVRCNVLSDYQLSSKKHSSSTLKKKITAFFLKFAMDFLLCYCAQCCDPTPCSVLNLLQWSVLGVLLAALTEDPKPHHCDIYQYLLLLPPQLLPYWSAFTQLFSYLFLNWHLQFAAFSLALVAFSFKFHSFSGIPRVIPLHLFTVESLLNRLLSFSSSSIPVF